MLNNKRLISCILILFSLFLILFCPCLKISRAAASMIGLSGDLLEEVEFLEEMTGIGSGLARDVKGLLRSLSDGSLSGGEALLGSFRLSHLIRVFQTSEFGDVPELRNVSLILALFILFFLALVLCGAAASACCWTGKKQRKMLAVVYTALLLILLVAMLILQSKSYDLITVSAAPFLALVAAGAACYVCGVSAAYLKSILQLLADRSAVPPVSIRPLAPSGYIPERSLCLVCRGGYQDGKVYRIGNKTVIGRNPDCSIQYPANYPSISRYHAILRVENGRLFLCDLSSTGTVLKRLRALLPKGTCVPVGVGDVFYLGEQKNRFEIIAM